AEALAHLARVALVGDVASTYHGLRLCQALLDTARQDLASRFETARLALISRDAGFTAPATAALADASAADGRSRTTQQQAACDVQRKALVALTGLPEPDIEQKMAVAQVQQAPAALFSIASLPADTLRQRPDVWAAEREVLAARAEIVSADAARWPGLSLGGNIGALQLRAGGATRDFSTWQFGPLQLSLPIFDGGRIAAGQAAARARYDEAVANYQGQVRQAVQEVETALTQGAAARAREADARAAVAGYRQQFAATEALYRQGMANLPQLEEARRNLLVSEITLAQLLNDQQAAGVALYRAAGGGWQAPAGGAAP
ncbi:MAG TPA: TolC family protein, partial [Ottowia sp.]|nr:TolC family protein [Ottowia sp.]